MVIYKKNDKLSASLTEKKFVTGKALCVILMISLLYVFLFSDSIKELPLAVFILMDLLIFFVVLHKTYQILYDIKLLFWFDRDFDTPLDFPKEIQLPSITFVIPSYQEPFNVAKMTFDSVVNAPYPGLKVIIVVDNSKNVLADDFVNWKSYIETSQLRHPEITVKFVYNEEQDKLKSGNLDLAHRFISPDELVVFLDVDSTLPNSCNLLERAVAEFEADKALGFIQFRIRATNCHFNGLTQAITWHQDLLRLRMISRGYGGYKIFEGHNGMWRKKALDDIGPWTSYYKGDIIITEDILKSVDAFSKGYTGKQLNIETGEWVPSSLHALDGMWSRWMYGNTQVFFKYFNKIYSERVSILSKFDISYHILHQFVIGCFFVVAFALQLLVPGGSATIFIVSMFVVPQLVGIFTSYVSLNDKSQSISIKRKVMDLYSGFFLIETFIMVTQMKSNIKFILGMSQGWKVTEKGFENAMSWMNVLRNRLFHVAMIFMCLSICFVSWFVNYGFAFDAVKYHLALLFLSFNLVWCIIAFGRQGRQEHNNVESAMLHDI
ncbi:cellulose synthase/poly-beta-1,6-N-acetylglucosamine synthase-like glycosyltransferase [Algoriphagus sp. 4150]|uniref:glycosyltransferase n=1 Tax=Algoriphagus sp. 4150 TaxID=2817756 RepID=UPI00285FF50A|nr:glycosyltransferase family 2 protein [Algoriphagus sp. 4150]MDR7132734.1 cellulose synthase/poly-beta-1,6-N-acetylglucosamine synthase-like glycosyltransferase [Algoriphagus sp. 4150]